MASPLPAIAQPESFCSFAITGEHESFQSIYVCRSCSSDTQWLCLCQACADSCHSDCDGLEYIGMGPSYCDCHAIRKGCSIQQASVDEAVRIHAPTVMGVIKQQSQAKTAAESSHQNDHDYTVDAYHVPALGEDSTLNDRLRREAHVLVEHSRDTFWIDADIVQSNSLCELERMAWFYLQRHVQHYQLLTAMDGDGDVGSTKSTVHGAEWWVQVKPISPPTSSTDDLHDTAGNEAIDLHYDKDEVLAESFGLGFFPKLATVTYLLSSQSRGLAPTVVLARRYHQAEMDPIPSMFLSHPRRGKHLVFDGSLLHGAPSHLALRESNEHVDKSTLNNENDYRVTFLVNIWIGHRPASVQTLDASIREQLRTDESPGNRSTASSKDGMGLMMVPKTVASTVLGTIDDLDEGRQSRIQLPFLCTGTTWETQNETDVQLVVSTFCPRQQELGEDTVRVDFGPGLEAFLESQETLEDEEDGDDMGNELG